MRINRHVSFALFVALVASCRDASPPRPNAPPPSPIAPPTHVTDASAFDVVGVAGGALAFWADPLGKIRAMRLSSRGQLVEQSDAATATGRVTELVGAFGGGRFGVAWVEEDAASARVRTLYGTLPSLRASAPSLAGESVRMDARGRLAFFGSDDGHLRLVRRSTPFDCTASEGVCERYTHTEVGGASARARSVDSMEIAEPCEPMVAGAASSRGAWFYSVCGAAPVPRAHVFSFRPDISYAAVSDGPAGCVPVALLPAEGSAWAVSRCGPELVVDVVPAEPGPSQRLSGVSFAVRCGDERGVSLVASGRDDVGNPAERATSLERPRSGLGTVLSTEAGARAAWTGEALLVGVASAGALRFSRHECQHGQLVETTTEGVSR